MKHYSIVILTLLTISACTTVTSKIDKTFVANSQPQLVIGFNSDSAYQLNFYHNSLQGVVHKLEVNFHDLPLTENFDLCAKSGHYQSATAVDVDAQSGKKTPYFESRKVDCSSTVTLNASPAGTLFIDYKLTYLNGYRIGYNMGYEVYSPNTSTFQASEIVRDYQSNQVIDLKL